MNTAHLSGLKLPGVEQALDKAVDNIMRCRGPKGGFGYRGAGDKHSLTPVGILGLQIVKRERGQVVRQALDFIVDGKDAPKSNYEAGDADLHPWYYGAQACFQQGGIRLAKMEPVWPCPSLSPSRPRMAPSPRPAARRKGALDLVGIGTTIDTQVYRNTLCVLMLEICYRYPARSR